MYLKNELMKNIEISLRNGQKVKADAKGCVSIDDPTEAAIFLNCGWKQSDEAPASKLESGHAAALEQVTELKKRILFLEEENGRLRIELERSHNAPTKPEIADPMISTTPTMSARKPRAGKSE